MTNTLLLPCGGKSNRFPNMKPKYMLTHPDGNLMIEKAIEGLDLNIFDRIIITLIKEHVEKYESKLILEQAFALHKDIKNKLEFCVLDDFTKSASETVALTIEKMNIKGSLVIKDCDNMVEIPLKNKIQNAIVGYNLYKHPEITNVPGKSFLIINEQNIIRDIIEKRIVSNIICIGVYCFENVELFLKSYNYLIKQEVKGEMFISNIISFLLLDKNNMFQYLEATDYADWGTLNEWKEVQRKYRTYFVDVDGVILKNCGKYGKINWSNNNEPLENNVKTLIKLQNQGAQIVITTSRTEEYRKDLEKIFEKLGLKPYAILMGMNHAARVIINDFASTNPYPSAAAITFPRNGNLEDYIN
ncbi:MAG TPA: HAD hydrolase family protein [Rickettsiales bacterium]|nr:HAD hydrolase family protein [Rickettsiales bacterium]